MEISLRCPAKVNLGLFIKGKRPDGYHELETIFLKVPTLYDDLTVQLSSKPGFQIAVALELPFVDSANSVHLTHNNIMGRVFDGLKYWNSTGYPGVYVILTKRIPMGAGLGGGSSNAFSMFLALKKLYKIEDTPDFRMFEQSFLASLGADVPAFRLSDGVFATGTGIVLQPIKLTIPGEIIVFPQPVHSNTKTAYQNLDLTTCNSDRSLLELIKLPFSQWQNNLTNDFEPSVFRQFPSLQFAKNKLLSDGFDYVSMSGSGSALFAIKTESRQQQ